MTAIDFSAIRCLLFTPGTRPERFEKALAVSPDGVILDLEDAVAEGEKAAARSAVATFARGRSDGPPVFVRINAIGTKAGLADLSALASGDLRPAGLVLPKVEDPRDVEIVRGFIGDAMPLLGVIETLRGLHGAADIAAAVGEGGALGMGGADLAAELGAEFGWEPLLHARSTIVAAAGSAKLASFDVPYLALRDETGLAAETARVRALGFTAKLAIHPAQIAPILAAFTPPPEAVASARRIVEAFVAAGGAAIQVDGRMIDIPLYRSAERTLRRAGAGGGG